MLLFIFLSQFLYFVFLFRFNSSAAVFIVNVSALLMLSSNPCLITSGTSRIAKPKLAYRLSLVTSVALNCLHSLRDLKLLRYKIIKSVKLLQRFTRSRKSIATGQQCCTASSISLPWSYLKCQAGSQKKSCQNECILFFYFANMIKEKQLSITAHCMKKLSNLNSWDLNPQRAPVAFLTSDQIHYTAYPCNTVWRIGEVDHHMILNPTELAHLQRLTPERISWTVTKIWDPSDLSWAAPSPAERILPLISLITEAILFFPHIFFHYSKYECPRTSKTSANSDINKRVKRNSLLKKSR